MKKIIVSLFSCVFLLLGNIKTAVSEENKSWVYVVSNGDSLWNISSKFLKSIDYYTQLQKLNNIKYPKKIKPGSVIRIPMEWIKHAPASAKISFVKGKSEYVRNNISAPLTSSTILKLGDQVHTSDNASATVRFADGSEMVLFKNTIVAFDHLSAYGKTGMVDTRIRVIQGKVETNAQKSIGPGSRLDISTPSAISSVRGTVYRVSNTGENKSTVEVLEGAVAVAGEKSNSSINVATGQGTSIKKGEQPTKPVALLSPPSITTTQTFFEALPTIEWLKNNKAEKYNIQLSNKESFKSIIWSQSTSETSITLPKLDDGKYFYRITAIDALGIEGIPANKALTLDLTPSAPELNHVPEKTFSNDKPSALNWQASVDGADSYQIEIAKDENFTTTAIKQIVKGTQFTLPETLAFDDYYWRVSSIKNTSKGTDKGPVSKALPFNWKTIISAPSCTTKSESESALITWSPIENNQTMIIEVAQDAAFTQILNTYQFDSNSTSVTLDPTEEVFVRCKLRINNSTIESQWGDPQHISQLDKGIMSMFGFLILVILI